MTQTRQRPALPRGLLALCVLAWPAAASLADAQEMVTVSTPTAVTFAVSDVSRTTAGSPDVTRIAFSNVALTPGHGLRLSVKADTAAFVGPGGAGIPATKVSWTRLGAGNGEGMSGALSASTYGLVFQSDPSPTSAHVDVGWTLAAPGSGVRAGVHDLTIRWKVEAISP